MSQLGAGTNHGIARGSVTGAQGTPWSYILAPAPLQGAPRGPAVRCRGANPGIVAHGVP